MNEQKQKVAVVLSGCGVFDGTEIHEAVLTLLAIEEEGATWHCFALSCRHRCRSVFLAELEFGGLRQVDAVESECLIRQKCGSKQWPAFALDYIPDVMESEQKLVNKKHRNGAWVV